VEEERVVWCSTLDQPVHSTEDVLLGRLAHGVLLVICEDHHILSPVPKVLDEVRSHVADVVDASSQLPALAEVVDTDEKAFPAARAVGVSECIALRGSLAKVLGRSRRRTGTPAI
jgi:hypothetical protein